MNAVLSDVREVLLGVAAYGLPGACLELPSAPLGDEEWTATMRGVRQQRIPGLLLQAIDEGSFAATELQLEEAAEAHTASMRLVLELERLLIEVTRRLGEAGISSRVLKGSALAHLDYPDPALRSFGDIDVLVPPHQYDRAVLVLQECGYHKRYDEPRPGFDRRFGKGAELRTPGGLEVDLHRTFVSGPFGLTVRLESLFESGTEFELGGQRLLALIPEQRLLHACFHAALGARPARLTPLRDIVQLALFGDLDVERVMALTTEWKVPAVVAVGIRLAWDTFRIGDVVPLSVWASGFVPDDHERSALNVYMDATQASFPAQAAAAMRAIPRWSERAAYLRAMAFPDRSYITTRDGNYARRFLRGARYLASQRRKP